MIKENPWLEEERKKKLKERYKYIRDNAPKEKQEAWDAVKKAVKDGEMKKLSCELEGDTCEGKKAPSFFHHTHGYSHIHIYTGIWVCNTCHKRIHREMARRQAKEQAKKFAEQFNESAGVIVLD